MIGFRLRTFLRGLVGLMFLGGVASATAPAGRYTIGSGTVKDNKTGLTWQRLAAVPTTTYTWANAKSYCPTLGNGWRLPTVTELMTLVDFSTAAGTLRIDTAAFPDTATGLVYYWSSSPYVADTTLARAVSFAAAFASTDFVTASDYVRCVH